jgi:hypothetical protein
MEKEFIPYAEALALKELGFNEPCFGRYGNDSKMLYKSYTENLHSNYLTPCPLYQQAFRWFREKYNLHPLIEQTQVDYRCSIVERPRIFYHIDNIFETYEEAELECLKKLIEIVKEKK